MGKRDANVFLYFNNGCNTAEAQRICQALVGDDSAASISGDGCSAWDRVSEEACPIVARTEDCVSAKPTM